MIKFSINDISMVRVTENDPCLNYEIPMIGIEQGLSHDTKLPNKPEHMPTIAQNFRNVLKKGFVEIWRLENPAKGCGAIFLTNLQKDGKKGYQLDDVVVLPEYRRKGLGTTLIQYTAHLAKSRGMSFVTWECEEGKYSQHVYRKVGAQPRENVKPFRLSRDLILKAIAEGEQTADTSNVSYTISDRFSLFRTVNHGIEGYDMDPTQKSYGLQIENVVFDTVENARAALVKTLTEYRADKSIEFVDIVIPTDNPEYLKLISSFDAEQNTYSGNPSYLWELTGAAFEEAAEQGSKLKAISNDNASYSSSQSNASTSAIAG